MPHEEPPPRACGALQPAATSSDQNTSSKEEEELNKEDSKAKEEEEIEVKLPTAPPYYLIDPCQLARNIANIRSSNFKALQNHANNAVGIFYNARENYKDAQHIIRLVNTRHHYINMRHDGPITSNTEEALKEAIISIDFPLKVSLQLYANKKVIVRKVLGTITRKTFKANNFKLVKYTLVKCTVTFKHLSGRGGTRAHDLDNITKAEAEELLNLIKAARAAAATVTRDISSPLPSLLPATSALAKKSQKTATPTPTPIQAPVAPLVTLSQNSSPINIKVQMTRNLKHQAKWERARKIIKDNNWLIQDLQLMEDEYSLIYNHVIKAGISDGFARSFREEIWTYKEDEAIHALSAMGGGF
ncbi:hypothetical protein BJY00DRAFT_281696 [Aspergillus carlsbadensis]|nr:hypothetical protein BJY00DRAFT_281696 [Aspergillus carlsbadensis]